MEKGSKTWGVRRCIKFRSLDEKDPHIGNHRDGALTKLDVNKGVYTADTWVCLDETGPVLHLARTESCSNVTNKLVRPGTKSSSEGEESHVEQELNGLEEGEDAMTHEEGVGVGGQGEAATADWWV